MESKVKTIEIVFENSESVLLDADQFEWFHLSCTEHTVSGRGYYIHKSLWTKDVGFVLKENIQEPDNYNIEGDKLGYWLDDSSLFGRMKYGDITQFHITYDDDETEVYFVDEYEEPSRYGGPNKNQSYEELDEKLKVTIGKESEE